MKDLSITIIIFCAVIIVASIFNLHNVRENMSSDYFHYTQLHEAHGKNDGWMSGKPVPIEKRTGPQNPPENVILKQNYVESEEEPYELGSNKF